MSYPGSVVRALFVFLLFATPAFAASISVVPTGIPASFSIEGSNMNRVAGIQLDITYDTALGAPTVTQGGLVTGAMLAANTSHPGLIKIAIISIKEFSGSGQIATIAFASKSAAAPLPSITYSMIDSNGLTVASTNGNTSGNTAAAGIALPPGVPFSQPVQQGPTSMQQQGSSAAAASSTASATTPTYQGTVTLPAELQQRTDSQPAPSPTAPLYLEEPAAARIAEQMQSAAKPAADAKAEETPQYVVYKGVLDRFKLYNGDKSLPAMAALFDKRVAQNIQQEPAILLSDGRSKATLTVDIPARINSSPNFAAGGGKLVSFKEDKQSRGRWIVEVLPKAGAVRVAVTIIAGAEEFEFPLTVAPPVKTTLTLDENGWKRFLKEAGTTTAPLHDLNNDGVRDYMDEFIFVANYLASRPAPSKPAAAITPKKK